MKKELFLYSTVGCHLCELAKEQLSPLFDHFPLLLVEIDIADDEKLLEKYGVRIPVIRLADTEKELGWPFDTQQVYEYLLSVQSIT